MSLPHAILGFLSYGPRTGYDLKKAFDASVQHFWSATQSQVYATLKRLSEDGLVEMETVRQQDRPDRKVYHITHEGQDELRTWLNRPLAPSAPRVEWLIKVFFADQLSNDAIAGMLEHYRAATAEHAAAMRKEVPPVIGECAAQMGSPRKRRLWELTFEYGQAMMRAQELWLAQAAHEVMDLPER